MHTAQIWTTFQQDGPNRLGFRLRRNDDTRLGAAELGADGDPDVPHPGGQQLALGPAPVAAGPAGGREPPAAAAGELAGEGRPVKKRKKSQTDPLKPKGRCVREKHLSTAIIRQHLSTATVRSTPASAATSPKPASR